MRQLGLDIFRCIAIFFVLMTHFIQIFYGQINLGLLGHWGVDFFFALSGFLVGSILIHSLNKYQNFTWIPNFLYRRWLKTFPLYYLVIFSLGYICGFPENFILYVFYLKGFTTWTGSEFYNPSWSLFVEEWFYMACAIFAAIIYLKKPSDRPKYLFRFCFLLILTAILYRFFYALFFKVDFNNPRKLAIARLDAPMFGVIIAIAKEFFPSSLTALSKHRNKILFLAFTIVGLSVVSDNFPSLSGILVCALFFFLLVWVVFYFVSRLTNRKFNTSSPIAYLIVAMMTIILWKVLFHYYEIYFVSVWFFSISSAVSALLLIYFITMPEFFIGNRLRSLVVFISQSSYAVYLTNEELINYVYSFIKDTPQEVNSVYRFITFSCALASIYLLAFVLVTCIENPILHWRNKKVIL